MTALHYIGLDVHTKPSASASRPPPARIVIDNGTEFTPKAEARRILRASECLTLEYVGLLLNASDADSANVELIPITLLMCQLPLIPVTGASQATK